MVSFLRETPPTNLDRHLNPHLGPLLALVVSLGTTITPIKLQGAGFLETHRQPKTPVLLLVVFLAAPTPRTKQVLQEVAFLDPTTIQPTTVLAKAHFLARNPRLLQAACLEAILAPPTIHLLVASLVGTATQIRVPEVVYSETLIHRQLPKPVYSVEIIKVPEAFSVDPTRTQEVCLEITTILIKAQIVSLAAPPTTHSTTPAILSNRNSQP